jgi:hypothetical protein
MLACPRALLAITAFVLLAASPAQRPSGDPLRFFEGRTESAGMIKVLFKNPSRTHSVGHGRIEPDGSLLLVQQVDDEGKAPFQRRWRIRQVDPGRYSSTMSQASGPVDIKEVGGRYRFRFKMKGNLSVEEWITPLPNGMSARNNTTVRKFGMKVAAGQGVIRKSALP